MNGSWAAWRRMMPVWLTAVLACLLSAGFWVWQASGAVGREAQLRGELAELEQSIARLKTIADTTVQERRMVAEVDAALKELVTKDFGSLEQRLTAILRAVGNATREAGLLPGSFSYSASEMGNLGFIRFGIQFAVTGQYTQVRQLLAAVQSSPQFLIVDRISFTGEKGVTTRDLRIAVSVATYLAEADETKLAELVGGLGGSLRRDG